MEEEIKKMQDEIKKISNGIIWIIIVSIIFFIIIFIIIATNNSRMRQDIEHDWHWVHYQQYDELKYRISNLEDWW